MLAVAERLSKEKSAEEPSPADAPPGFGTGPEGDQARLGAGDSMDPMVQERVNHVADLIGAAVARRVGRSGDATVRFAVDGRGYVRDHTVEISAGMPELDAEIPAILHLAEPYPGQHRTYRVVVPFHGQAYGMKPRGSGLHSLDR